jgi:TonB family protein
MRLIHSLNRLNRTWHAAELIAIASALVLAASLVSSMPARAESDRKVIARVKAVYPEEAKRLKIVGTVLLSATVEPSGRVKAVSPVMGEKLLLKPAQNAVSQWRFTPSHYETVEDVEVVFP